LEQDFFVFRVAELGVGGGEEKGEKAEEGEERDGHFLVFGRDWRWCEI